MGAWGANPFDNDTAMEWVTNSIEMPFLAAIKDRLEHYLAAPQDDTLKHEVEAAVALLCDLTADPARLKYCRFALGYYATEAAVWDLAIAAIQKLKADSNWLADWNNPERKAAGVR